MVLLCITIGNAQNSVSFEQQHSYYINGGSLIYGNNILSKHEEKPFHTANGINDNTKMTYVDIDKDPTTFSSSAVQIDVPENSTIINATLYWAGTYPGATGKKKRKGKKLDYVIVDEVDQDISKVRIKINKGEYRDVSGQVIFNASNATDEVLISNKPYVCKADVTELMASDALLDKVTVANVPAALGYINGGSTAGWLLFIAYENPNSLPHFITLYDGFEFVKDQKVAISIKDFKSAQVNDVSSRITIAAMDGDSPLKRDNVQIYNPKSRKSAFLSSSTRSQTNFFNSSIDENKEAKEKRFPYSRNTLGFDIAQVNVTDKKGLVLPKNTENIEIQYATKADSFYVFFTAFQTQIDQEFLEQKDREKNAQLVVKPVVDRPVNVSQVTTETPQVDELNPKVEKAVQKDIVNETPVKQPAVKEEVVVKENTEKVSENKVVTFEETDTSSIRYYIITNVFSNSDNAIKWMQVLEREGFYPDSFIHPENGLEYVFIASSESAFLLRDALDKARENPLLKKAWVKKME
ncbi:hypothetical protein [Nonlabens sp.]|uniref:hypothetical protein n=1 Tax=Nonlabens sp. TaxID=1888209 RepID=UPI003F698118